MSESFVQNNIEKTELANAIIILIMKTKVLFGAVNLKNGKITWHPVFVMNMWRVVSSVGQL